MDVTECASSPCKDTAPCVDCTTASSRVTVNAYRCKCTPGFANGACDYAFITQYKTQCTVAESRRGTHSGNYDVDVDECKSNLCKNGATCKHSAVANKIGHHSYSCA
jgi:hypothetical protein